MWIFIYAVCNQIKTKINVKYPHFNLYKKPCKSYCLHQDELQTLQTGNFKSFTWKMLCLKCQKEGDSFLLRLDYHISRSLVTPATHRGRAEHRTLLQTAQRLWVRVLSPSSLNPSYRRCTLMQKIQICAAERKAVPFNMLLSSLIVSVWGSPFKGIHASAFEGQ